MIQNSIFNKTYNMSRNNLNSNAVISLLLLCIKVQVDIHFWIQAQAISIPFIKTSSDLAITSTVLD